MPDQWDQYAAPATGQDEWDQYAAVPAPSGPTAAHRVTQDIKGEEFSGLPEQFQGYNRTGGMPEKAGLERVKAPEASGRLAIGNPFKPEQQVSAPIEVPGYVPEEALRLLGSAPGFLAGPLLGTPLSAAGGGLAELAIRGVDQRAGRTPEMSAGQAFKQGAISGAGQRVLGEVGGRVASAAGRAAGRYGARPLGQLGAELVAETGVNTAIPMALGEGPVDALKTGVETTALSRGIGLAHQKLKSRFGQKPGAPPAPEAAPEPSAPKSPDLEDTQIMPPRNQEALDAAHHAVVNDLVGRSGGAPRPSEPLQRPRSEVFDFSGDVNKGRIARKAMAIESGGLPNGLTPKDRLELGELGIAKIEGVKPKSFSPMDRPPAEHTTPALSEARSANEDAIRRLGQLEPPRSVGAEMRAMKGEDFGPEVGSMSAEGKFRPAVRGGAPSEPPELTVRKTEGGKEYSVAWADKSEVGNIDPHKYGPTSERMKPGYYTYEREPGGAWKLLADRGRFASEGEGIRALRDIVGYKPPPIPRRPLPPDQAALKRLNREAEDMIPGTLKGMQYSPPKGKTPPTMAEAEASRYSAEKALGDAKKGGYPAAIEAAKRKLSEAHQAVQEARRYYSPEYEAKREHAGAVREEVERLTGEPLSKRPPVSKEKPIKNKPAHLQKTLSTPAEIAEAKAAGFGGIMYQAPEAPKAPKPPSGFKEEAAARVKTSKDIAARERARLAEKYPPSPEPKAAHVEKPQEASMSGWSTAREVAREEGRQRYEDLTPAERERALKGVVEDSESGTEQGKAFARGWLDAHHKATMKPEPTAIEKLEADLAQAKASEKYERGGSMKAIHRKRIVELTTDIARARAGLEPMYPVKPPEPKATGHVRQPKPSPYPAEGKLEFVEHKFPPLESGKPYPGPPEGAWSMTESHETKMLDAKHQLEQAMKSGDSKYIARAKERMAAMESFEPPSPTRPPEEAAIAKLEAKGLKLGPRDYEAAAREVQPAASGPEIPPPKPDALTEIERTRKSLPRGGGAKGAPPPPPSKAGGGGKPPRKPPTAEAAGPAPKGPERHDRPEHTKGHVATRASVRAIHEHARANPKEGYEQRVYDNPHDVRSHVEKFGDEPYKVTTGKNATEESPGGTERTITLTSKHPPGFSGFKKPGSKAGESQVHHLVRGFEVTASGEYKLDPDGPGGYAYRSFHVDEPVTIDGPDGSKVQFVGSEKFIRSLESGVAKSSEKARGPQSKKDKDRQNELIRHHEAPPREPAKAGPGTLEPRTPEIERFGRQPGGVSAERIPVQPGESTPRPEEEALRRLGAPSPAREPVRPLRAGDMAAKPRQKVEPGSGGRPEAPGPQPKRTAPEEIPSRILNRGAQYKAVREGTKTTGIPGGIPEKTTSLRKPPAERPWGEKAIEKTLDKIGAIGEVVGKIGELPEKGIKGLMGGLGLPKSTLAVRTLISGAGFASGGLPAAIAAPIAGAAGRKLAASSSKLRIIATHSNAPAKLRGAAWAALSAKDRGGAAYRAAITALTTSPLYRAWADRQKDKRKAE